MYSFICDSFGTIAQKRNYFQEIIVEVIDYVQTLECINTNERKTNEKIYIVYIKSGFNSFCPYHRNDSLTDM